MTSFMSTLALLFMSYVSGFQNPIHSPMNSLKISNQHPITMNTREQFKKDLPGKFLVAGRNIYFDPLCISKSASIDSIKLWREAELMHGRVSMLAFLHVLTTEFYNFHPLQNPTDPLSIHHLDDTPIPLTALLGSVFGAIEFYRAEKGWLPPTKPENLWKLQNSYEPGDLGFDPLNLSGIVNSKRKLQEQELNNGRLAALAMAGIVAQELYTNKPVFSPTL